MTGEPKQPRRLKMTGASPYSWSNGKGGTMPHPRSLP